MRDNRLGIRKGNELNKPDKFTMEDFERMKQRYSNPTMKSLELFKATCPCPFTEFTENEQCLMSFSFCQGYEACLGQVQLAQEKGILLLDREKACEELNINDPQTS